MTRTLLAVRTPRVGKCSSTELRLTFNLGIETGSVTVSIRTESARIDSKPAAHRADNQVNKPRLRSAGSTSWAAYSRCPPGGEGLRFQPVSCRDLPQMGDAIQSRLLFVIGIDNVPWRLLAVGIREHFILGLRVINPVLA